MLYDIRYKGEDIVISIQERDKNGNYINLNTKYRDVVAILYTDPNEKFIFGRNNAIPFSIEVVNEYLYIIRLLSQYTTSMKNGTLKIELRLMINDTTFPDSDQDIIVKADVCSLNDSEAKFVKGTKANITAIQGVNKDFIKSIELYNVSLYNTPLGYLRWETIETEFGYLFKLYKDDDFEQEVAVSEYITKKGEYKILPSQYSGLTGSIDVDFKYKLYWALSGTSANNNPTQLRIGKDLTESNIVDVFDFDKKKDRVTFIGKNNIALKISFSRKYKFKIYWKVFTQQGGSKEIRFYASQEDLNSDSNRIFIKSYSYINYSSETVLCNVYDNRIGSTALLGYMSVIGTPPDENCSGYFIVYDNGSQMTYTQGTNNGTFKLYLDANKIDQYNFGERLSSDSQGYMLLPNDITEQIYIYGDSAGFFQNVKVEGYDYRNSEGIIPTRDITNKIIIS